MYYISFISIIDLLVISVLFTNIERGINALARAPKFKKTKKVIIYITYVEK